MKPFWRTLKEDQECKLRVIRKEKAFYRFIEKTLPVELQDIVTYSFSDMGEMCIRVFLYFDKDITADQLQPLFSMGAYLKKKRWEFSKFFRQEDGLFAYRIQKKIGMNDYIMFFENAPDVDGCVLKKKTIEKEVFYSDCGELEKTF
jgi:hypothetical protein